MAIDQKTQAQASVNPPNPDSMSEKPTQKAGTGMNKQDDKKRAQDTTARDTAVKSPGAQQPQRDQSSRPAYKAPGTK